MGERTGRGNRGPATLTIVGIVMTVVGWGAFVLAFVVLGANLWDDTAGALDPRDDLEAEVDLPGRTEVDLGAGDWVVLALGPSLTTSTSSGANPDFTNVSRGAWAEPSVVLTSADGTAIPTHEPELEVLRDAPGLDAASLTAFTLDEPTTVVLASEGSDGAVTALGIAEETDLVDEVASYAIPTIVAVLGAVVGSIGPFLAVFGGIWWVLRSSGRGRPPPPWPPGSFPGGTHVPPSGVVPGGGFGPPGGYR